MTCRSSQHSLPRMGTYNGGRVLVHCFGFGCTDWSKEQLACAIVEHMGPWRWGGIETVPARYVTMENTDDKDSGTTG